MDDLGRTQPLQLRPQRRFIRQLSGLEVAGGQVHQREAEDATRHAHRGQKVVALRDEHALIEMRAG
jgi:hypothetical protein